MNEDSFDFDEATTLLQESKKDTFADALMSLMYEFKLNPKDVFTQTQKIKGRIYNNNQEFMVDLELTKTGLSYQTINTLLEFAQQNLWKK